VTDQRSAGQDPPGTINGAVSPELIADQVAYSLILRGIAEQEGATEEQTARARAKIQSAEVNTRDAATIFELAAQFEKQVVALDEEALAIHRKNASISENGPEWQQLMQLNAERNQLINDTIALLNARLSPEGLQKLGAYVQAAKRRMKVYPK
jgi:hypothetical protein